MNFSDTCLKLLNITKVQLFNKNQLDYMLKVQEVYQYKALAWEFDIDSLTGLEITAADQFSAAVLISWKYYKEMYVQEIDA